MIAYNLTDCSLQTANSPKTIELIAWAMCEDGNRPRHVCVLDNLGKVNRLQPLIPSQSDQGNILGSTSDLFESISKVKKALEADATIQIKTNLLLDLLKNLEVTQYQIKEASFRRGVKYPIAPAISEALTKIPEYLDPNYIFTGLFDIDQSVNVIRFAIEDKHDSLHFFDEIKFREKADRGLASVIRVVNKKLINKLNAGFSLAQVLYFRIFFDKSTVRVPIINPERLGHLVGNTDVFLSEMKLGLHGKNKKFSFTISNNQYVEGVGRICVNKKVANPSFIELLRKAYKVEFVDGCFEWAYFSRLKQLGCLASNRIHGHRDIHGVLDKTKPNIELPDELLKAGNDILERNAIDPESKIALIHARDGNYITERYLQFASLDHKRYSYRNVDIGDFEKAIDYLISHDYELIRVGCTAPSQAKTSKFWYSKSLSLENWFDLFLFHKCDFLLGNTSGVYTFADLFRKPIIFTNFAPLGHVYSWSTRHITIFKRLVDRKTDVPVPASQQIMTEVGWTIHMDKLNQSDLIYVSNSQEEVYEVTKELVERIRGSWIDIEGDHERQRVFWETLPRGVYHSNINSRIGAKFLKDNPWLLE